ncbi:unnamed protein product [Wuchereria bancrofti]|uniref:ACB domain-containing protein n=1 Tax=Wuchereria bancrofti TaxID=6293 RepID=A0A3P7DV46_WUCBA|nr:unnamed protein product [Wuchereria bancrofti]
MSPMVPTNDEKLMFYSLYKQATEGKNKNAQPNFLHFLQKAKWFLLRKTRMIESNECFENFSSIEFREFEEREALNSLPFKEAWKKLGEMSSDEAKKKYINLVKQTINEMSRTMDVNKWLQQIDPTLSEKLDLIIAE